MLIPSSLYLGSLWTFYNDFNFFFWSWDYIELFYVDIIVFNLIVYHFSEKLSNFVFLGLLLLAVLPIFLFRLSLFETTHHLNFDFLNLLVVSTNALNINYIDILSNSINVSVPALYSYFILAFTALFSLFRSRIFLNYRKIIVNLQTTINVFIMFNLKIPGAQYVFKMYYISFFLLSVFLIETRNKILSTIAVPFFYSYELFLFIIILIFLQKKIRIYSFTSINVVYIKHIIFISLFLFIITNKIFLVILYGGFTSHGILGSISFSSFLNNNFLVSSLYFIFLSLKKVKNASGLIYYFFFKKKNNFLHFYFS